MTLREQFNEFTQAVSKEFQSGHDGLNDLEDRIDTAENDIVNNFQSTNADITALGEDLDTFIGDVSERIDLLEKEIDELKERLTTPADCGEAPTNTTSTEPTKKFQEGDRVRIISHGIDDAPVGTEATVVDNANIYEVSFDTDRYNRAYETFYYVHELELVSRAIPEADYEDEDDHCQFPGLNDDVLEMTVLGNDGRTYRITRL